MMELPSGNQSAGNMLEIKIDQQKLQEVRAALAAIPHGIEAAVSRAINKTAITARKNAADRISKHLNLKTSDIKVALSMYQATRNYWQAGFEIGGKKIPLIKYGASQTEKGVKYKIERKGAQRFIRSAFVQTMPSGHKGVFMRGSRKRLPIFERKGPSLGYIFEMTGDILRQTIDQASENLERNLDAQVKLLLGGRIMR